MKVKRIEKEMYLSTTLFDPSPNRFKVEERPVPYRSIPVVYQCENCGTEVSIKTSDFEKHANSAFSNLTDEEDLKFAHPTRELGVKGLSFLDFYCPDCNQSTRILFCGGPSGYWGEFYFEIVELMVIKK